MMKFLPDSLLEKEVAAIIERYKISREDAEKKLCAAFAEKAGLLEKINARYALEDVTRWREYRDTLKKAKKKIYYSLRRYRRNPERGDALTRTLRDAVIAGKSAGDIESIRTALLRSHASTDERFPYYDRFYDSVFSAASPVSSVLDLGCGLHPLSFPFEKQPAGGIYLAVDRHPDIIEILTLYAKCTGPWKLLPILSGLDGFDPGPYLSEGKRSIDLIFMLKLIPVLERQKRHLLSGLASLSARVMLITASVEAMSRKEKIAAREDRSLRHFIDMTGREIDQKLSLPNEFGFFLV